MPIKSPRRGPAINTGQPTRLDRDDSTVLRSPNARAARLAMTSSAFADEAPPLPTARLRQSYLSNEPPAAGLPSHFSFSTGQSLPLINSLDRYPSRGNLTPRKAWHSSLAVRAALTLSVVLLITFAFVHSIRSGGPFGVTSNMAACEPSYDTLIPSLRRRKTTGSQHIVEHEDVMGALGELRPRIAMVTMADSRKMPMPRKLAYMTGIEEGTEVDILQVVWRNRKEYADRHGYTLINGTDIVGDDRPPAWYKLKVVESVLNEFDWVFYLDSDAWITNPEIPLETLLPAQGGADFVVTEDAAGANAGAWIIRSSDWSRAFLKEWWGLESFVRSGARAEQRLRTGAQKGDTKSGDNDALKYLVREMDKSTRARRVAYPPQCALNSYLWRVSMRQWWRWLTAGSKIRSGIWRPGHLLVHLAGWNNYQGLMQLQRLLVNRHNFAQYSTQSHGGASRKLMQPPEWQQLAPPAWQGTAEDLRAAIVQDDDGDAAAGILRERRVDDGRVVHFGSADDLIVSTRRAGGAGGVQAGGAQAEPGVGEPASSGCGGNCMHGEHDVIEEGDELYDAEDPGVEQAVKSAERVGVAAAALADKALREDGFGFSIDYSYVEDSHNIRKGGPGGGSDGGDGGTAGGDDAQAGEFDELEPDSFGVDVDVYGDAETLSEDLAAGLPEADAMETQVGVARDAKGAGGAAVEERKAKRAAGKHRKGFWPMGEERHADKGDIVAAKRPGDDGDYEVHGWVDSVPEAEDAGDGCGGDGCGADDATGEAGEDAADVALDGPIEMGDDEAEDDLAEAGVGDQDGAAAALDGGDAAYTVEAADGDAAAGGDEAAGEEEATDEGVVADWDAAADEEELAEDDDDSDVEEEPVQLPPPRRQHQRRAPQRSLRHRMGAMRRLR